MGGLGISGKKREKKGEKSHYRGGERKRGENFFVCRKKSWETRPYFNWD